MVEIVREMYKRNGESSASAPALDFIVIGAQKAGTTSLWSYLQGHPLIHLPAGKEAPFFVGEDGDDPTAYAAFYDAYFSDVPRSTLVGTVTPHYMMGNRGVTAEGVAERIAGILPAARLIAILRDPIDRAISHYRMSVRRGLERRSFEQAAEELLDPTELERARLGPDETNSYLIQGEYGRILSAYDHLFPREQLCVLRSEDLEERPGEVLDRVLFFLGLQPGYRPDGLDIRHHRGGSRARVDQAASAELLSFLELHIFPKCTVREREAFLFFFETWNVIPDDEVPQISGRLRAALQAHFGADAARLGEMGVDVPWASAAAGDGR